MGWGLKSVVWMALGAALAVVGPARGQENIGSTAESHNQVSKELPAGAGPLGSGDPVYRDEGVLTGPQSTAKLIFLDSTNLAVGPISRVKLDRFVYEGSSQEMGVKLAKGLFRFTTGVLDKNAYSVTTPTAAIGVRGTVLDIAVNTAATRVTLIEGKALVCPVRKGTAFEQQARDCVKGHSKNCECVELEQEGQTAQVSHIGGQNYASLTTKSVQFAKLCVGDGSLCSEATYASLAAANVQGLCGR